MELQTELETYRKLLPSLLDQEGRYVLIHGNEVVATFATREDALRAGYERFGLQTPFFTKRIQKVEKPRYFSRNTGHGQCQRPH